MRCNIFRIDEIRRQPLVLNIRFASAMEWRDVRIRKSEIEKGRTYASSKPVIASLIPSAPSANVPYGSLPEPDTLLSSETFSDSSLKTCQHAQAAVGYWRDAPKKSKDS